MVARPLDRLGDPVRDVARDRPRQLRLEARRRAEMMKEIGMSPADLTRDRLQRHRLRPLLDQQPASGVERDGTALFGVQALAAY